MNNRPGWAFHAMGVFAIGIFLLGEGSASNGRPPQEVRVTIEGYTFRTTQMPLELHTETIIHITNRDNVRHDFGSSMFLNTLTHVESNGVVTYGKGVEGAFLDPGQEASIRLILDQPGRFQFQCSIHTDMKGEILLLIVDAA
jgi:plastocyanin